MAETIFAIMSMVFGAVCLFLLSDRTRQLRETRGRLDALEVNLEGADRQINEMRARQEGGGSGGGDIALLERRLQQAQAEIERLRAQVNRSEERIKTEQERAEREIAAARDEADRAIAGAASAGADASPVVAERLARLTEAERWIEDLKKSLAEAQSEARSHADRALELEQELTRERAEAIRRASRTSAPLRTATVGAKAGATGTAVAPTTPPPPAVKEPTPMPTPAASAPESVAQQAPVARAGDLTTATEPPLPVAPAVAPAVGTSPPRSAARAPRKAKEPAPPRGGVVVGTGSAGVVLVIDGDPESVEMMSQALQSGNYRVALAFTADEGMKLARTIKPTAIALDPRLADRDGWELLADLVADNVTRDIPLFVIGGRKDRDRATSAGAAGWLPRGSEPSVVLSALRSSLIARSRRASRAAAARGVGPAAGEAEVAAAAAGGLEESKQS